MDASSHAIKRSVGVKDMTNLTMEILYRDRLEVWQTELGTLVNYGGESCGYLTRIKVNTIMTVRSVISVIITESYHWELHEKRSRSKSSSEV
jgi:hypothetical protein